MISWDYPSHGNLRQLVDSSGFHPITAIQSLLKKEKTYLLHNEIILCRQLINRSDMLRKIGITENRISRIINEATQISANG